MRRLLRGTFGFSTLFACLALLLALATTGGQAAAAPTAGAGNPVVQAVDSDGDGIPDDLDPDDNNDGTTDDGSSNGPIGDDDGDGIPNDLDPDDNNNGITDENETGASSAPAAGGGSSSGGNAGGGAMIRALPVTGTGPDGSTSLALAYGLAAVFLCGVATLHRTRELAAARASARD